MCAQGIWTWLEDQIFQEILTGWYWKKHYFDTSDRKKIYIYVKLLFQYESETIWQERMQGQNSWEPCLILLNAQGGGFKLMKFNIYRHILVWDTEVHSPIYIHVAICTALRYIYCIYICGYSSPQHVYILMLHYC